MILQNAKLESEVKRVNIEHEEAKVYLEKQMILLRNREETILKMSEDLKYLNFNTKKLKSEVERSTQDSITYHQIVRKLEKDLKESESKREKVEAEFAIFKQNLGYKK